MTVLFHRKKLSGQQTKKKKEIELLNHISNQRNANLHYNVVPF